MVRHKVDKVAIRRPNGMAVPSARSGQRLRLHLWLAIKLIRLVYAGRMEWQFRRRDVDKDCAGVIEGLAQQRWGLIK